jgi:hypothetical protein
MRDERNFDVFDGQLVHQSWSLGIASKSDKEFLGQRRKAMRIAFYAQTSHLDEGSIHMTKFTKSIAAGIAAATMVATVAVSEQASAAPFVSGAVANAQTSSTVKVGWRHGGGWGWGPGALIGGIVGGALIASAVAEHRADRNDMDRCARDFPDFSYRTGTYIDRRGDERVCPYLR